MAVSNQLIHTVLIGLVILASGLIVLSLLKRNPKQESKMDPTIGSVDSLAPNELAEEHEGQQADLFSDDKRTIQSAQKGEQIFSLYVMARDPYRFTGYELLQVLLSNGFRFGKMNIFHRYPTLNAPSEPLFSLASATEPGVFDINNMGAFSCQGLILFSDLGLHRQSVDVLQLMVSVGKQLADELDGMLLNDKQQLWDEALEQAYFSELTAVEEMA